MPLDIFDHPVVERLVRGERVRVQELRRALVEFWEKNGTFSICSNCPIECQVSATGCCRACKWHDLKKGCTRRNLACLTFTCGLLRKRLMDLGLWERYDRFYNMCWNLESYFNSVRLPDKAELFLVESGAWFREEVQIASNQEGVHSQASAHLDPEEYLKKLSKTDSVVSEMMYRNIKSEYPDSQVQLREDDA